MRRRRWPVVVMVLGVLGLLTWYVVYTQQVVRELREETGLVSLVAPTAVALLFDPGAFSWEVVHRLEVAGPSLGGHAPEVGWEYDEFAFVADAVGGVVVGPAHKALTFEGR